MTGGYRVETVEECVTETQTGFQRRRPERQIDGVELRDRLETVHTVEDLDRARLAVRVGNIALDEGEAALWAHTLSRIDDWILCGPDKASLLQSIHSPFLDAVNRGQDYFASGCRSICGWLRLMMRRGDSLWSPVLFSYADDDGRGPARRPALQ